MPGASYLQHEGSLMNHSLYLIQDRELLASLADFQAGFQNAAAVLEGLTEEQATAKPHGLPHSIADIVAHMWYWQEFFNRVAEEGFNGFPEHAEVGWPKVGPGEWDSLRERFLSSVERTKALALTCSQLDEKLLPADFPLPLWERESIGTGLLHGAIHSFHHLGQVITLRQLLGLWPPKAGSMTW
jgi:uncharacterized damage-inducible protein DinB